MVSPSPASVTVFPVRPGRRRQRSVRVTVAVCLLGLATALVLVALPTRSLAWLSSSAVLSLACGWAAARIVYSELVQSRREAAADRAEQAEAYRSLFADRASEHAEFTTSMTDRLIRRGRELAEAQSALVDARRRALEAEAGVHRLTARVGELEEALAIRHAEEVDELASWGEGLSVQHA